MEKISGIIPSSARVASVDMREAAPTRPGTPSFGRPEGMNALRERERDFAQAIPAPSTAARGVEIQQSHVDWRAKDDRGAAIVKAMSDKFFGEKNHSANELYAAPEDALERMRPLALSGLESKPANGHSIEAKALISESRGFGARDALALDSELAPRPEEMYPRGSFIDYHA